MMIIFSQKLNKQLRECEYGDLLIYNDENFVPGNVHNDQLNTEITADEVTKAINQLKTNKAVGIDNIANEILKIPILCNILHPLFNKCFEKGIIRDQWLKSIINPIPKRGKDPRTPLNTRPLV